MLPVSRSLARVGRVLAWTRSPAHTLAAARRGCLADVEILVRAGGSVDALALECHGGGEGPVIEELHDRGMTVRATPTRGSARGGGHDPRDTDSLTMDQAKFSASTAAR